jgi:UDP-glucuronate 4-epimerase
LRHALVTGGAGFIGSHLVDALLSEGWHVTTVDNFDPFYDAALKRRNIVQHLRHPAFHLVDLDIRDASALSALEGQFDVIVHLAAKAGVRPSILDPMGYQQTNVQGTQNLLELAQQRHIEQFVFASSSSVYGVNPRVPWHEEDSVLQPISPYAATKAACELLGHVYSHLYGIRFIALRLFTVYGPRQRPDLAIHKFARLMLEGKPVPVFGDGTSRRDYTYISNIVDGVCAAIEYTGSAYEIINLGNNNTISLSEMIRHLETMLDVTARLDLRASQPGDVAQTWADIGKAQRLLGWRPRTTFTEGLSDFCQWIRHPSRP